MLIDIHTSPSNIHTSLAVLISDVWMLTSNVRISNKSIETELILTLLAIGNKSHEMNLKIAYLTGLKKPSTLRLSFCKIRVFEKKQQKRISSFRDLRCEFCLLASYVSVVCNTHTVSLIPYVSVQWVSLYRPVIYREPRPPFDLQHTAERDIP
jgi:hypothetical protein